MRKLSVLFVVLAVAGCSHTRSYQPSNSDGLVGKNWTKADRFIDRELKIIEAHKQELVKLGRMSNDFGMAEIILGRYDWHGDGPGYFGAYSFYQPAFEQAKRGWFLHGEVLEGSNELWPHDDWDTKGQSHIIHFDESIIGYTLPEMYMSWFKDGKYTGAWFTAKIIGIAEDGHIAILDRRAPHHAEQWQMQIVPNDWQDMCACTDNFGPKFENGNLVVEP
jgi:hypothetical protein